VAVGGGRCGDRVHGDGGRRDGGGRVGDGPPSAGRTGAVDGRRPGSGPAEHRRRLVRGSGAPRGRRARDRGRRRPPPRAVCRPARDGAGGAPGPRAVRLVGRGGPGAGPPAWARGAGQQLVPAGVRRPHGRGIGHRGDGGVPGQCAPRPRLVLPRRPVGRPVGAGHGALGPARPRPLPGGAIRPSGPRPHRTVDQPLGRLLRPPRRAGGVGPEARFRGDGGGVAPPLLGRRPLPRPRGRLDGPVHRRGRRLLEDRRRSLRLLVERPRP